MSIPTHLQSYLKEAVAGLRWEAMKLFARELMSALEKEGYQLEDLLQGLASYVNAHGENWEPVVKLLEDAAEQTENLKKDNRKNR